jgi:cobaltochelatase CobN
VLSASTEQDWEDGLNGLSARDIAMNVALPEVDGRILSRAVSFKGEAFFDEATECPIATYKARGDRISFVAALASNWAKLRRTPAAQRQVALVLANYPNKDGRLANGVGLDTPASAVHAMTLLREAGYDVQALPADSAALMAQIMAGPTNWLTDRAERSGGETLPLVDYLAQYQTLPYALRTRIVERWGDPS